jgi:large subunit ribosomal protein L18
MRKIINDLKFRRRRLGLTNYQKRLALVKGGFDRVVVRKTNKRIIGQVVRYEETGDKIIVSADSNELAKKFGWPSRRNRPTAYLTGMLLAKKSKATEDVVLDIGITAPVKNSIPFVFARGCIDGGLKLRGKIEVEAKTFDASLIAKYAELIKKDAGTFKKQFGGYAESGVSPENLPKLFNEVKTKIMQGSG